MQKHPELGSPPTPDWCTAVTCREEVQILESQLEDIARRGSVGLDVTAKVLDRLKHDYGSLLATYRKVIKEQVVLNDDVKHLKCQSRNFNGSKMRPFLYCAEVRHFASLDTLYLCLLRIPMRPRLPGWTMFAMFPPSDLLQFTDLSLDYPCFPQQRVYFYPTTHTAC